MVRGSGWAVRAALGVLVAVVLAALPAAHASSSSLEREEQLHRVLLSSAALNDPETRVSARRLAQATQASEVCASYQILPSKQRKKQCRKDRQCYYNFEEEYCSATIDPCEGLQRRGACRRDRQCRWFKKKLTPKREGEKREIAVHQFCAEKNGPGPKGSSQIVTLVKRFTPPGSEWAGLCDLSVAVKRVRDVMDIPPGGDYANIEWKRANRAYNKHLAPLIAPGGVASLTAEEEAGSAYIRSAKLLYGQNFLVDWIQAGLDGTATETSEARRQIVEKGILDWLTGVLISGWLGTLERNGMASKSGQDALGKAAAVWTGCGFTNTKGGPSNAMYNRAELRGPGFGAEVRIDKTQHIVSGMNADAILKGFAAPLNASNPDQAREVSSIIQDQFFTVEGQCCIRYSKKLDEDIKAWEAAGNSFGPPTLIPNPQVFGNTPQKNQAEGDTFFKVFRPLMALSDEGPMPGTQDTTWNQAAREIARAFETRQNPHMPNYPSKPSDYCYFVNGITGWLKSVGWGKWFGILAEKEKASYCCKKYPTAAADGGCWPDPPLYCTPSICPNGQPGSPPPPTPSPPPPPTPPSP